VDALIVEAVAAVVPRSRQLTLGAVAGFLIGTVGFAAGWLWSDVWMPLPWTTDVLPEAAILAAVAGTAGGLLGGMAGRAVTFDGERQPSPRFVPALAWLGAAAGIGLALPMTANRGWTADIDVASPSAAESEVSIALSPAAATAAEDSAWFHVLAWQGSEDGADGGSSVTDLVRQPDGTYRTDAPVPITGNSKTMLRLHDGSSLQSVPIYLPEDPAIPAEGVAPIDSTRSFEADKRLLQREARTDNVVLERAAYAALALVAVAWLAVLAWGLARIERPPTTDRQTVAGRDVLLNAPWPTSPRHSRTA
jgi:hypothetical protein